MYEPSPASVTFMTARLSPQWTCTQTNERTWYNVAHTVSRAQLRSCSTLGLTPHLSGEMCFLKNMFARSNAIEQGVLTKRHRIFISLEKLLWSQQDIFSMSWCLGLNWTFVCCSIYNTCISNRAQWSYSFWYPFKWGSYQAFKTDDIIFPNFEHEGIEMNPEPWDTTQRP